MKLTWYGHASFRLETESGFAVVTDPYDPATSGYKPVPEPADLVVVSSTVDSFHNNSDLVPGEHETVDALALALAGRERVVGGVRVRATPAMEALDHDEHDPEQNGLYRLTLDGVEVGHMGDVGNPLSAEQIDFFRGVDVLLALAGGFPTLALDDLKTVIDAVQPARVVPMHFRTLRYRPRNSLWIASFLEYFDDESVDFACDHTVTLARGDLGGATRVLVLDYF